MDETGAYYTLWSKSERKTSIQYINTYIWDLEKAEESEMKLPTSIGSSEKARELIQMYSF